MSGFKLALSLGFRGFAALFEGAIVVEEQGLGVLEIPTTEGVERLHPMEVLDFQETHADIAFTLDFPIPPKTDPSEATGAPESPRDSLLWELAHPAHIKSTTAALTSSAFTGILWLLLKEKSKVHVNTSR